MLVGRSSDYHARQSRRDTRSCRITRSASSAKRQSRSTARGQCGHAEPEVLVRVTGVEPDTKPKAQDSGYAAEGPIPAYPVHDRSPSATSGSSESTVSSPRFSNARSSHASRHHPGALPARARSPNGPRPTAGRTGTPPIEFLYIKAVEQDAQIGRGRRHSRHPRHAQAGLVIRVYIHICPPGRINACVISFMQHGAPDPRACRPVTEACARARQVREPGLVR